MKIFTRELLTGDAETNADIELEIIGRLIKEMKECVGKIDSYQIIKKRNSIDTYRYMMTVPYVDPMKCRICGCDDMHACPGGCWWMAEELCSQCFEKLVETWRGRLRLRFGWPAFYREMRRKNKHAKKRMHRADQYGEGLIERLRNDARKANETLRTLREEETEKQGWKALGTKEGLCDHYEMKITRMNEEEKKKHDPQD